MIVGASTTLGQIPLQALRHDFDAVIAALAVVDDHPRPRRQPDAPMHYTFNTPVGAPPRQQCGRVLFDDFHVEDAATRPASPSPPSAPAGPMTPQEKLLEFMIFDLGSCVDAPTSRPARRKTCAQLGVELRPAGDGCGGAHPVRHLPRRADLRRRRDAERVRRPLVHAAEVHDVHAQCGPIGDGCGGSSIAGRAWRRSPAGETGSRTSAAGDRRSSL